MARFIYFIPGPKEPPSDERLQEVGLGHLVGNNNGHVGSSGPTNNGGAIIGGACNVENGVMIGYYKDRQTWEECNNGKFWIGYQNDFKPGPEDLKRMNQLEGHEVELGDKNEWLIPVARRFDAGCVLPKSIYLDGAGLITGTTLDEYISYSKKAEDIFNDLCATLDKVKNYEYKVNTYGYMFEIALEALNINYNISKWEMSILKLLNTKISNNINLAIVDFNTMKVMAEAEAVLKKKESTQTQNI